MEISDTIFNETLSKVKTFLTMEKNEEEENVLLDGRWLGIIGQFLMVIQSPLAKKTL